MNRYSPSALETFRYNCPFALAMYRSRKDRRYEYAVEGPDAAEIGQACHAMLHAAGVASAEGKPKLPAVEAEYIAQSRVMQPVLAREGYQIASKFIQSWEFPPWAKYEHGVAFDDSWHQVEWDSPLCRIRMIYDVLCQYTYSDEECGDIDVAVAMDYKSGWSAGPKELDSIQMKAQAIGLRKMFPGADAVEVRIVSVRTGMVWSRRWILEKDEDKACLIAMQRDVELEMQAADQSDGKPRVGVGCAYCQYSRDCESFAKAVAHQPLPLVEGADATAVAQEYAAIVARKSQLEAWLRVALQGRDPAAIPGGVVGYRQVTSRVLPRPETVVDLWFKAYGDPANVEDCMTAFRGLMAKAGMSVTAASKVVKAAAKGLGYKTQKAAIEAEGPKLFDTKASVEFGITKNKELPGDAEEEAE